jgi:hypothetical protein
LQAIFDVSTLYLFFLQARFCLPFGSCNEVRLMAVFEHVHFDAHEAVYQFHGSVFSNLRMIRSIWT